MQPTHTHSGYFYTRSPEVEPWVFRWTFSSHSPSSSPPSHLQLGALELQWGGGGGCGGGGGRCGVGVGVCVCVCVGWGGGLWYCRLCVLR